jgi:hypothetical protein
MQVRLRPSLLAASALLAASPTLHAEATVAKGHATSDAGFKFAKVPTPAVNDAAAKATLTLIDGQADRGSGALTVLTDGKIPANQDSPRENFFFAMNTAGGRIGMDLGGVIAVKSIGSYSWHAGGRGPQVYAVHAADGTAKDFNAAPKKGTDPASVGWKLVTKVDTRLKEGNGGGQHGVEIANQDGKPLGEFRHLLFDVAKTADADPHGNTFFSEIDVVDAKAATPDRLKAPEKIVKSYKSKDGKFRYIIDSSKAPALTEWTEKELLPVIEEWYPKLVELLPSDGYRAPDVVNFEFRDDMGGTPAYAAGNRISLSATWFPGQLQREAKGCVVHEMGQPDQPQPLPDPRLGHRGHLRLHPLVSLRAAEQRRDRPRPQPSQIRRQLPDHRQFPRLAGHLQGQGPCPQTQRRRPRRPLRREIVEGMDRQNGPGTRRGVAEGDLGRKALRPGRPPRPATCATL